MLYRIFRSLLYNKGTNLIILCLFTFLFCILINTGITSLKAKSQVLYLKSSTSNMVVLEKVKDYSTEKGVFYSKDIQVLTKNKYVKEYNAVGMNPGVLVDAKACVKDEKLKQVGDLGIKVDDCNLIGITNSNYHLLFTSGSFKIIEGNHITESDSKNKVCMISKELAEKNNLKLWDTITFSPSLVLNNSTTLTTKIIGIYEYTNKIQPPIDNKIPSNIMANYIFVPGDVLRVISYYYSPIQLVLYLKDSSQIQEYIHDMTNKLSDTYIDPVSGVFNYKYHFHNEWFDIVGKPVQDVNNMASIMVIIIAIGTYMVVLLVSILILTRKKTETGIYLSMGESKTKLILQMIVEQMSVIFLSLIVASFISFFTSENITKSFIGTQANKINEQIEKQRNENIKKDWNFYLIENDIKDYGTSFFYIQDSSLYKLILFIALGIIIIIASLIFQMLLFFHRNSVNTLLQKE